jgi:hypothetical protein
MNDNFLMNPPTDRLGIVHFSLQRGWARGLSNPPTGRLGIVHFSLQRRWARGLSNPPTGRLGIVHFSLFGASELLRSECITNL